MNNLKLKISNAQREWSRLKDGHVPIIYLGTASCGRAAGAMDVLESVCSTLEENRLEARIFQVGCIGPCYLEPLMDVEGQGLPRISYANVKPTTAKTIIESYLIHGDPQLQLAVGHFGQEPDLFGDSLPRFMDLPMLKPQVRVVLRNCGLIDPEEIDHYLANYGYIGLVNALNRTREEVIGEVREAGLRGRGELASRHTRNGKYAGAHRGKISI